MAVLAALVAALIGGALAWRLSTTLGSRFTASTSSSGADGLFMILVFALPAALVGAIIAGGSAGPTSLTLAAAVLVLCLGAWGALCVKNRKAGQAMAQFARGAGAFIACSFIPGAVAGGLLAWAQRALSGS